MQVRLKANSEIVWFNNCLKISDNILNAQWPLLLEGLPPDTSRVYLEKESDEYSDIVQVTPPEDLHAWLLFIFIEILCKLDKLIKL